MTETSSPGRAPAPSDALRRLTDLVGYIRVTVGADEPHESDEPNEGWLPAERLVHDDRFLYDTMRIASDGRGVERDDIGMSLLVQGYAFRVASVAIGCWMLGGGVVDVAPGNTSIRLGRNRPNAVRLDDLAWVSEPVEDRAANLDVLHHQLVDGHLEPLVDTAGRATRAGNRMLWSNVATGCASAFGALMGPLPDEHEHIRDAALAFFDAARPELRRGGEVAAVGPTWLWQRNACCLYYQEADQQMCGDCSLHDEPARQERRQLALEEATR